MKKEQGRSYLAILDVHGRITVAEGNTREEVEKILGPTLEYAKRAFPGFDWGNASRVFRVVNESQEQESPSSG